MDWKQEAALSFDSVIAKMAEKWREVPGGSDRGARQFSDDLIGGSTEDLIADWDRHNREAAELRDWWWRLYAPQLKGKKVLDVGAGRGFDALHFAAQGADVTCCDIAPTNLELVRRVAAARGVEVRTLHIHGIDAFDRLPSDFDVIWCNGSLLHLPFEAAREECAAILSHLKGPGGRWIELAYPRERWVREGSLAFDRWGVVTDGERTPWAEWYDMEKLKRRLFPVRLAPVFEHRFSSDSFIWMDAEIVGRHETALGPSVPVAPPGQLEVEAGLWRPGWSTALPSLGSAAVTVDITCVVETGTVGLALERDGVQIAREICVEARTGSQLLHLTTQAFDANVRLASRNASALGPARYAIQSIELRPAL